MICEMNIRIKDKDYGDPAKNKKAGDVITLHTEEQIKSKFGEIFAQGRLSDYHLGFTDITKPLNEVTLEDLQKAELRWPWTEKERKVYCIVRLDLTEKEIDDLKNADGYLQEDENGGISFVQTSYRKKNINWDGIKAITDEIKFLDNQDEYQPFYDEIMDKSYIASRSSIISPIG